MLIKKYGSGALMALVVLSLSCKSVQVPVKTEFVDYRITAQGAQDSALSRLLQPYRDSVDRSMSQVVGAVDKTLEKKQPEGTLGNFMVDAFYYGGEKAFGVHPDLAILNYGGIRLTQLPAGPVTRGKVFELMPFDNLLVLQRVPGNVLQQVLDHIAGAKGWPVHGVSMEIRDGKAANVLINGAPLDPAKVYTLVNSDYVATGGDNAAMLKAIPFQSTGYLMRDALFDYIRYLKSEGKNISANEEKRVYVP
jgi:2',3'-cyclic-nucleotide 2'-phosphodiesterase (5'-nucleotidase family)